MATKLVSVEWRWAELRSSYISSSDRKRLEDDVCRSFPLARTRWQPKSCPNEIVCQARRRLDGGAICWPTAETARSNDVNDADRSRSCALYPSSPAATTSDGRVHACQTDRAPAAACRPSSCRDAWMHRDQMVCHSLCGLHNLRVFVLRKSYRRILQPQFFIFPPFKDWHISSWAYHFVLCPVISVLTVTFLALKD